MFQGLEEYCGHIAGGSIAGARELRQGGADIAIFWDGGVSWLTHYRILREYLVIRRNTQTARQLTYIAASLIRDAKDLELRSSDLCFLPFDPGVQQCQNFKRNCSELMEFCFISPATSRYKILSCRILLHQRYSARDTRTTEKSDVRQASFFTNPVVVFIA